jgi:hypothetical protein
LVRRTDGTAVYYGQRAVFPHFSLRKVAMAEYIQIVKYESDDINEVIRVADSVPVPDGVPKPTSVLIVRDRDHPDTYMSILRFDSYEDAMRHSESDATHERIGKLAPLMKSDARFYNLDILAERTP